MGKTLWKSQNVSLNGFFQEKHHPAPAVFVGGGTKLDTESDWVMSDQTYEDMDDELNIEENDEYYEDESRFHSFLPNHPQHHTYEVQCKSLSELIVPNCIGGTLP